MDNLKIILVDDNTTFREALKNILVQENNAIIIGEAGNAEEFWQITNYWSADIIFMDVMMPGINGIELTKSILWNLRQLKIIAITLHTDKVYLSSLVEAGFLGCIFKNNMFNELQQALLKVMNGGRYFPSEILIENKPA